MAEDIPEKPSEEEITKFRESMGKMIEKSQDDASEILSKIQEKLEQYGSLELMAQIAILETRAHSPMFHNASNPMSEHPFALFLSGIFLNHNNLSEKIVLPQNQYEIISLLTEYFQNFRTGLMSIDPEKDFEKNTLVFLGKQEKIFADVNPRSFPNQKIEHIRTVFTPIDNYFTTQLGFSINNVIEFLDIIVETASKLIFEKQKIAKEKYDESKKTLNAPRNTTLKEKLESEGGTDYAAFQFADINFTLGAESIFVINIDEFCKNSGIIKKNEFRKLLSALSCGFGKQLETFSDPLSENILNLKPFIKIDEDNYFCPILNNLNPKLDIFLEYLLNDEKLNDTSVWKSYVASKSKYLEDKTYEYFLRIFPEKYIHRNLFYWLNGKRLETDLLVFYDNKIILVESKSNHLPISAKRGGLESLEQGLKKIIKKAYIQAKNAQSYIQTSKLAVFENESGKEILKINGSEENFHFILVNSTLEILDTFATNLRELDVLGFFENNDYPWSINLYDLDVITDCIPSSSYFLHYIHQRLETQKKGVFSSITEGEFLGYYFKYGNFYEHVYESGKPIARIALAADFFDQFEKYYLFSEKKPSIDIEPTLGELIKNLEKYYPKGFTDITSLLLDFPLDQRKIIAKKMKKKLAKTKNDQTPDEFYVAIPDPYDIGFSYFTSITTTEFHNRAKKRMLLCKYGKKIKRWAMIGRNVSDTKNFATVSYYENSEWKHDESLENDLSFINSNYFL